MNNIKYLVSSYPSNRLSRANRHRPTAPAGRSRPRPPRSRCAGPAGRAVALGTRPARRQSPLQRRSRLRARSTRCGRIGGKLGKPTRALSADEEQLEPRHGTGPLVHGRDRPEPKDARTPALVRRPPARPWPSARRDAPHARSKGAPRTPRRDRDDARADKVGDAHATPLAGP